MAKFVDVNNRAWPLAYTVGDLDRVKRDTGVDLKDALSKGPDGLSVIERVANDMETFVAVLYSSLEPQLQEAGVDPDQFALLLNGDALESGMSAAIEALIDFFPKRLRIPLYHAWTKIAALINQPLPLEEVDKIVAKHCPATVNEPSATAPAS